MFPNIVETMSQRKHNIMTAIGGPINIKSLQFFWGPGSVKSTPAHPEDFQ